MNTSTEKRVAIVTAADQLFYQRGYNHCSFSDIAKFAQFPRGQFYYYFKSKEAILDAVVDARVSRIKGQIQQWTELGDAKQRIIAFIDMVDSHQSQLKQYGCPYSSLLLELGKQQSMAQERSREMLSLFLNYLNIQFAELKADKQAGTELLLTLQGAGLMEQTLGQANLITEQCRKARDRVWAL